MERKKKSGWEFTKKRLARDKELSQNTTINSFFTQSETNSNGSRTSATITQPPPNIVIAESPSSSSTTSAGSSTAIAENSEVSEKCTKRMKTVDDVQNEKSSDIQNFDKIYHDPTSWLHITDPNMRQLIIRKGPMQIKNIDFPAVNGRRFSPDYYSRRLANGEIVSRPWLIYSKPKDLVFCFCCLLFPNKKSTEQVWPKTGTSDWVHLSRNLSIHEKSTSHLVAFKEWKELDLRLKSNRTIDAENERIVNREITHWRHVLERIISIIQFLAGQSLALRGSSDKLYESNNGNFLKLIELFEKFDPIMAEHVSRIVHQNVRSHYLSNVIQNEIIAMMSDKITKTLVNLIESAKYYSIILDCTPDISHVEEMSVIIRLVAKNQQSTENEYEIHEHFIGFLLIQDTSGEGLTNAILQELKRLGIPIENMRGQGYDNGANMRGKRADVQNRILTINPRAFFVPCSAHTLNLVVNDAASASGGAVGFFQTVQKIFTFFSGSTHRWDVLKKHISALSVKSVSDTRWESRVAAVKPLRYQLGEIYDALIEISDDKRRDNLTQHEARSLAKSLIDYRFICSIVIWYDILIKVNVVSKMLQNPILNLVECKNMLTEIVAFFEQYRSEEAFSTVLKEAADLASELETEPIFHATATPRPRRKRRFFDYESQDEPISDPQERFKIEFFYLIVDTTITSLKERFQLLETHCSMFELLYDIHRLKNISREELMKCCKDLHIALTHRDSMDIDAIDLCDELMNLSSMIPSSQTPIQSMNYIAKNGLESLFENVLIALRILLTLPVSVASGERSFSKLKLIKSYLRSTMSQERLTGLAIISIEKELCASLKYNEIIDDFAKLNARRVAFQ